MIEIEGREFLVSLRRDGTLYCVAPIVSRVGMQTNTLDFWAVLLISDFGIRVHKLAFVIAFGAAILIFIFSPETTHSTWLEE